MMTNGNRLAFADSQISPCGRKDRASFGVYAEGNIGRSAPDVSLCTLPQSTLSPRRSLRM